MSSGTRTRSRIAQDSSYPCFRDKISTDSCYGTETIESAQKGTASVLVTEVMQDVVTPNYRKRSAEGEIINNPLTQSRTTLIDSMASYSDCIRTECYAGYNVVCPNGYPTTWYREVRAEGNYSGSYLGCRGPADLISDAEALDDIDKEHLGQIAVTQAYANIDFSEAALYETLGELNETLKFLGTTIYRATRIFRAARRLDLRYLRKEISPRQLADRYMELRYGLRPLLYDCKNIMETLRFSKFNDRYTFRGKKSDTVTSSTTREYERFSGFKFTYEKTLTRKVTARAGVLVEIDQENPPSIWGLDQPIEAMWELTHFSFIADWFFNIGQTIASWTPNLGTKDLASWCTFSETLKGTEKVVNIESLVSPTWSGYGYNNAVHTAICSDAYTIGERFTKTRNPNPKRAIWPTYNVNLNVLKILDLAIIAKSVFSGRGVKAVVRRE